MSKKNKGLWYLIPAFFGILAVLLVYMGRIWPASQPSLNQARAPEASPRNRNQYFLELTLDERTHQLLGRQTMTYINNSQEALFSLVLHLYPNAFSSEENVPIDKKEFEENYPKGFSAGNIELKRVMVGGQEATVQYSENKQAIRVLLREKVVPGRKITLDMSYTVTIPRLNNRFGYGDVAYSLAHFYPAFAVNDEDGWHFEDYTRFGDPFYYDTADYQVVLHVPQGYEVAHTGNATKDETAHGIRTLNIQASSVREFVFACSKQWKIAGATAGKTRVLTYALDEGLGKKLAEATAKAIMLFGKRFGDYPYDQLSVVETDLYGGGMEYPNIVAIDTRLYDPKTYEPLLYTVIHEAAHQWWYVWVGNNQIAEPWLDEGLTEYSTYLYFKEYFSQEQAEAIFDLYIQKPFEAAEKRMKGDTYIDRALTEYDDVYNYAALAYWRSAIMYRSLHETLGDDIFFRALQTYVAGQGFGNATREDLIKAFSDAAGKDMHPFFAKWLDK